MATTAQVYGYARVSTLTQVRDGEGLQVQREKIAAWSAFQGLPVALLDADEGVSGAAMDNRPALRRVLRAALQTGPGAVLVVYKLDRLGRDAIDVQETLAVLLDAGVRVVSLADGVDSASDMGRAMLRLLTSILATFAELEKETIRARLQDGRKRADANDRAYASEPRYGRRRVDADAKELAADAEEQRAVERVRDLRAAGLSYRAIAQQLEAEGLRPRRAAAWSPIVLQRIATGKRTAPKPKANARIARARAALLADEGAAA